MATVLYCPKLSGKSVTEKAMLQVQQTFLGIFGDLCGWAHTVLFAARLQEFKHRVAEDPNIVPALKTPVASTKSLSKSQSISVKKEKPTLNNPKKGEVRKGNKNSKNDTKNIVSRRTSSASSASSPARKRRQTGSCT